MGLDIVPAVEDAHQGQRRQAQAGAAYREPVRSLCLLLVGVCSPLVECNHLLGKRHAELLPCRHVQCAALGHVRGELCTARSIWEYLDWTVLLCLSSSSVFEAVSHAGN